MGTRSISGAGNSSFGAFGGTKGNKGGGAPMSHNSPIGNIEASVKRIMLIQGALKEDYKFITSTDAFKTSGQRSRSNFDIGCQKYGGPIGYLEYIHDELTIKTWHILDTHIKGKMTQKHIGMIQRILRPNKETLPLYIDTDTRNKIFTILNDKIGTLYSLNYPPKPIKTSS